MIALAAPGSAAGLSSALLAAGATRTIITTVAPIEISHAIA
jgi:hypothetical protein